MVGCLNNHAFRRCNAWSRRQILMHWFVWNFASKPLKQQMILFGIAYGVPYIVDTDMAAARLIYSSGQCWGV